MICLLLTLSDPRPGLFKTIQTFQLPWTYLQEMQICILGSISNFWAEKKEKEEKERERTREEERGRERKREEER